MEKDKIHKDDILGNEYLKENPFTLPKGYFAQLEDSVSKRIHTNTDNQERGIIPFLKTAVLLACTFGAIVGMGYGAMYLTNQSKESSLPKIVENSVYHNTPDSLESDIIEIMSSAAILDTMTEEDEQTLSNFDTLVVDKDNIEEYLIESNISLITLASLE